MTTIEYHGRKILLDDDMLRLLQWALERPGRWVKIGPDIEAVRRLVTKGLVEIFEAADMYRVSEQGLAKRKGPTTKRRNPP
jgi:hypothetical protein